MITNDSPCHANGDCPKRCADPNCHGYCEDYIIWAELKREENRMGRHEQYDIQSFVCEQRKRIRATQRERSRERNS